METTQTDTLLNGYKIIQDKERFMFGIDAVLISDFARKTIKRKECGIDLGTGTGIIPLLLTNHVQKMTGLEIQEDSAEMAKQSVALNNLENKITVIQGDVKNANQIFAKHSFDFVISNPPYMIVDHGEQSPKDAKAIARHEVLCTLEDIISAADYLLKPHGCFYLVHRPFRLSEIFSSLYHHKMEPKRMQMVSPFKATEPNIVLLEARKNANPRLKIEPELIVYEKPGEYTKNVQKIYERTRE